MYVIKDGAIRISVRNLVEFVYNSGDIDNRTGSSQDVARMQEGARIHRAIQKKSGADYAAEVPFKINIPVHDSYIIALEGRADGVISSGDEENPDVCIDEIKTVTGDVGRVKEPVYVHKAQAMCYAYICACEMELERIRVRMTYCSIDDEAVKYFYEDFSFDEIEKWFNGLIEEFSKWTDFVFEERDKRNASIKGLKFPFPYRPGQKELAASVYRACASGSNLYIEAPTGTGKTVSTIYPAVMAVGEGHGDKIFYLTAKTITRTVAEQTYGILREGGLHYRTVTLTARDKVCILEERNCNPDACPYAKGHFDRVNDAVYDVITHETAITRDIIVKYAALHNVCPFELSLDISLWCDGIICDYNYVFDPNVRLKRFFADGMSGGYIFLVDEAHNLVDRGRSMYSAAVVKEDFLEARKYVKGIDKGLASALDKCNKDMLEFKRECRDYNVISSVSAFAMHLERAYSMLQKFLDKNRQNPHIDYRERLMEIFLSIRHFLNMHDLLTDKYVIYTEHDSQGQFFVRLFCVDPSDNLNSCIEQGICAVLFSATLLPVRYFKEMLTGKADDMAVYAKSSFDTDMRRIIVGRDVSSRYSRRGDAEYRKIAEYIFAVTDAKRGNYMVFFPSYGFMQSVLKVIYDMTDEGCFPDEFEQSIMCQDSSMNEEGRENFLKAFDNGAGDAVTGFCVMGGIFSEGINLKNEQLIGAVIVGAGLPMVCTEQKLLQEYFDDSGKNGFDYAYVYPGMNKVMQAAGRVIRTEEDRGVIALLDERFLYREYRDIFPREWNNYIAVRKEQAAQTLREFWESRESV